MNELFVESFEAPPVNYREIRRYAGQTGEGELPIDACLKELSGLTYRVAYREFPIRFTEDTIDLGFAETKSKDLRKNLEGCSRILLFAATIGFSVDRVIEKYNRLSPVKALLMQAVGSERVEALCDDFNNRKKKEYAEKGCTLRPRFSAGYGDLPISLQKETLQALNAEKTLGIVLNEHYLMKPSKSVTAVIGIRE